MGLAEQQLASLNTAIAIAVKGNAFYQSKIADCGGLKGFDSLDAFSEKMPFTTKRELAEDYGANPPYGSNLSYDLKDYTRLHQTSGTTGRPMAWLDTPESWSWIIDSWAYIWRACGAKAGETAIFPFSFGPFIGFWAAFEAASKVDLRCIPLGGQQSFERLQMIFRHEPQWLCCTPTYALHLMNVAERENVDLTKCSVRGIIVGGEPGGSVAEVRSRIEEGWGGARVFDHHGMTEVGPVTYSDKEIPKLLRIIHEAYYAEVVEPETGRSIDFGNIGELVLTTLGRNGSPLFRYRTGDLVKPVRVEGEDPRAFVLEGGIIGRADDMVVVRGINLYPSAVDAVIRSFEGFGEYQVSISKQDSMVQASIRVENISDVEDELMRMKLQKRLREVFALRIPVNVVELGTLPQFEMKAKRWSVSD